MGARGSCGWCVTAGVSVGLLAGCGQREGAQQAVRFELGEMGTTVECLVYVPRGYGKGIEKWPVVLFLHGAGECGEDVDRVREHGLARMLDEGKELPCVVVSPQSREHGWKAEVLLGLLDEVCARYRVDEERVYVTGLSMGGFGTWAVAAREPGRFAAAVPICGGGDPAWAERLKGVPMWAFHGGRDDVVPIGASEEMVEAVKKVGGDVRFTVYPEAGHDCWTQAYGEEGMWEWMLGRRRREGGKGKRGAMARI